MPSEFAQLVCRDQHLFAEQLNGSAISIERPCIREQFMKINSLRLTNIRCFKELNLELNGESALLVGDNGDGKSTVLRSLAMGLVDDSSAAALFRDLYGESIRKDQKLGRIEVELANGVDQFSTHTTITPSRDSFERVEQELFRNGGNDKVQQDDFPWEDIFVTGYGPGIRVYGTADYDYYLAADALYPLFVYDKRLQNPELVMRRLITPGDGQSHSRDLLSKLKALLANTLQLESSDRISLEREGIMVNTGQGKHPLTSAGDGYHAVVTCLLDLLSWWFLRESDNLTDVEGIVLIDEIEQHLHPRWQRNIVKLLTKRFKRVQFIITTHSPLVASGCKGIQVHRLNEQQHEIVEPFGWRAEEVYSMMGVDSSRAEKFEDWINEFQKLDEQRLRNGPLSAKDQKRFKELYNLLERVPGTDPVRLALSLQNIEQLARDLSKNGT